MSVRPPARVATILALAIMAAACTDSNATAPEAPSFDLPTTVASASVTDVLIAAAASGGPYNATNSYLSLASLPTTGFEGVAWTREITLNYEDEVSPVMAVDYGDGSGPVSLDVDRSGGEFIYGTDANGFAIIIGQHPYVHTVTLTHAYAAAGTYPVLVALAFEGEEPVVAGVEITIAPSNEISVEDLSVFGGLKPMEGQAAGFSFTASGPPGTTLQVSVDFGDGSEPVTGEIEPGATFTGTHTWPVTGVYPMQIVVSTDAASVTTTSQVTVVREPPSFTTLELSDTILRSQTGFLRFEAFDPAPGALLTLYIIQYTRKPIPDGVVNYPIPSGVLIEQPRVVSIDEPRENYRFGFVLKSLKNGVLVSSDTTYRYLTVTDVECPAGEYRVIQECFPTPVGTYVPEPGADAPIPCAVGTYQNQTGQLACIPAPAGSFVPNEGSIQAELCAPGSYQDETGAASCKQAAPGQFVVGTGAVEPSLCAPGTFQPGSGSTSCEDAGIGHFATGPGAAIAEPCAVGTFAASTRSVACDPAPAGSFVDQPGQSQAQLCSIGTFSAVEGSATCEIAPPGTFVDAPGASAATLCAVGTFQSLAGQTSCVPAPAGTFVSTSGAAEATLCSVGSFQPNSGQVECIEAPIGSYVDIAGAVEATMCPEGTSTLGTGSTSADACQATASAVLDLIEQAVADGTLVGIAWRRGKKINHQRRAEAALRLWVKGVEKAIKKIEGRGRTNRWKGCWLLGVAIATADGRPHPRDLVEGSARDAITAALRQVFSGDCTSW